jgi:hypothetical protein
LEFSVADDIVTRLRERQREVEEWWPNGEEPLTLAGEAADEIERLRAENTRLASFLHPIGATIRYDGIKDMTSEQVDQILKVIRETHRG